MAARASILGSVNRIACLFETHGRACGDCLPVMHAATDTLAPALLQDNDRVATRILAGSEPCQRASRVELKRREKCRPGSIEQSPVGIRAGDDDDQPLGADVALFELCCTEHCLQVSKPSDYLDGNSTGAVEDDINCAQVTSERDWDFEPHAPSVSDALHEFGYPLRLCCVSEFRRQPGTALSTYGARRLPHVRSVPGCRGFELDRARLDSLALVRNRSIPRSRFVSIRGPLERAAVHRRHPTACARRDGAQRRWRALGRPSADSGNSHLPAAYQSPLRVIDAHGSHPTFTSCAQVGANLWISRAADGGECKRGAQTNVREERFPWGLGAILVLVIVGGIGFWLGSSSVAPVIVPGRRARCTRASSR